MDTSRNGPENGSERAAQSEEQPGNASLERYSKRRSLVMRFLQSELSPCRLQHYQSKAELLKKCGFYLQIEPRYLHMREQNQVITRTDILQMVDRCQLQRMKKVAKNQCEIQLSLLTELLEQLQRGREELSRHLETCDMVTFLSSWDFTMQKLLQLIEFLKILPSLQVPGKLHIKHCLMLQADLHRARLPNIRLSLHTKPPVIFDRKESFAYKERARLQWFPETQESHLERYDLQVKLVTSGSPTEMGYGRLQTVTSNMCIVQGLQPDRCYEFTIRRSTTETLVLEKWQDSITLKTRAAAAEREQGSACALKA
nr:PREDICTED: uncharacterized protein C20orf195 homolog [Opisthocomus hoazin]